MTSASEPFELPGIGRLAAAEVGVMFAIVENGGVPEATTMSDYFLERPLLARKAVVCQNVDIS